MGQRRGESSHLPFISAIAAWALLELALLSGASVASAGSLSGLSDPVREATAPVVETVEAVVPPVTTPTTPNPIPTPGAAAPPTPPPSPSAVTDAAGQTAKAGSETVRKSVGTATSAVDDATQEAKKGTREVAAAVEGTADQATAPVMGEATGATASAAQSRPGGTSVGAVSSSVEGNPDRIQPATADAVPAAGPDPASLPAKLWHPLIHVWPAVALTAERALGDFVGHWSRAVLAHFERAGVGSLRDEGGTLANSAPASQAANQPPFSGLLPPSLSPFDWIPPEGTLPVFVFLLILAAGTLAILLAMRRQLGEPLLPRRITRWWR
jgi:hypothetical protein